jgi:hypothetical protein
MAAIRVPERTKTAASDSTTIKADMIVSFGFGFIAPAGLKFGLAK